MMVFLFRCSDVAIRGGEVFQQLQLREVVFLGVEIVQISKDKGYLLRYAIGSLGLRLGKSHVLM